MSNSILTCACGGKLLAPGNRALQLEWQPVEGGPVVCPECRAKMPGLRSRHVWEVKAFPPGHFGQGRSPEHLERNERLAMWSMMIFAAACVVVGAAGVVLSVLRHRR